MSVGEMLTNFYPADEASREQIRLTVYERMTLTASHRATLYGRSMRCERGDHGCLNNGTTCLCRCHDKKGT